MEQFFKALEKEGGGETNRPKLYSDDLFRRSQVAEPKWRSQLANS